MTDFDCDTKTARQRFIDIWDHADEEDKFDHFQLEKIFYFLWNNLESMLESQGIEEEIIIDIMNSFFGDGLSTVEMVNDNFHIFEGNQEPYGHLIYLKNSVDISPNNGEARIANYSITTTILEAL